MRRLRFFLFLLAMIMAFSCRSKEGPRMSPEAGGAGSEEAGSVPAASLDGRTLVINNCMSCHGEDMLEQQRLTAAQWTNVVKKMSGWGSPISPSESSALVAYLASSYGPDAGPYEPRAIGPAQAMAQLEAQDDGPFSGGDPDKGKSLFTERCSVCHGPEARGQLGVNLVDRPILYRVADMARIVRSGKGLMAPLPATTDKEMADIVAHLRRLR